MSNRLQLFIGSSSEGLRIAEAIAGSLSSDAQVVRWPTSVKTGETIIEGLDRISRQIDFAVFVFSDDDRIISRRQPGKAPRDNVVFELGLFSGRLGRDRCYVVCDERLKLLSDLQGVRTASYKPSTDRGLRHALALSRIGQALGITPATADPDKDPGLHEALQKASAEVRALMIEKGEFEKISASELEAIVAARRFTRHIKGDWWTIREWDKKNSVGFVRLSIDRPNGMPKVDGHAYDGTGEIVGTWWSVTSWVQPLEGKLHFRFDGHHPPTTGSEPSAPNATKKSGESEEFLGFTTFTFDEPLESPVSGKGVMSDLNVDQKKVRAALHLGLLRCTPEEGSVMTRPGSTREQIAAVVRTRLG
jgi:Predicted nucleotide-binding protein containing TIR-like domain